MTRMNKCPASLRQLFTAYTYAHVTDAEDMATSVSAVRRLHCCPSTLDKRASPYCFSAAFRYQSNPAESEPLASHSLGIPSRCREQIVYLASLNFLLIKLYQPRPVPPPAATSSQSRRPPRTTLVKDHSLFSCICNHAPPPERR